MILKLLLIVAVIAIVYFIFFKKKPLSNKKTTQNKKDEKLQTNDMVECSACGVYVELDESLISNNHYYCSTECLEKK